ncbi:MAG: PAS domain-containing sensor histidine kinase [bacterium]
MKLLENKKAISLLLFLALLVTTVLDIVFLPGMLVGFLYLVLLILSFWLSHRILTTLIAMIATVFIVTSAYFEPVYHVPFIEELSVIIPLFCLWVLTFLIYRKITILENLTRREELYRKAIEVADAVPYYQNYIKNTYEFVGEEIKNLTGYSAQEFTPDVWVAMEKELHLLGLLQGMSVRDAVNTARQGPGTSWRADYHILNRIGERKWLANAAVQVKDSKGNVIGSLGILQDITERKRTEEELRNATSYYHSLVQTLPQQIFRKDIRKSYTFINQRVCNFFGVSKEGVIGKTDQEIFSSTIAEILSKQDDVVLQRGETHKETIEIPNVQGDVRLLQMIKSPVIDNGKVIGLQGLLMDITDLRKVEEENRILARFPKESPNPILRISADGILLYANPASRLILEFWKIRPGDRLPETWCEFVQRVYQMDTIKEVELKCMEKTYSLGFSPVPDLMYVNAFGRDITDVKDLEEQLRQVQKMEAIGRLAGGIAHEFNNLLTGMIGNIKFAMIKNGENNRTYLKNAYTAAERAATLVQQMLSFSRKKTFDLSPMDLNQLIEEVLQFVKPSLDPMIEMHLDLSPDLPLIQSDANEMNIVLMNLITNAQDAIHDKMASNQSWENQVPYFIRIHTLFQEICEKNSPGNPSTHPGSYVVLSVKDNGIGMDEKVKEKIFEPFFTTKVVGKGTGLGLASVYGIIEQHKGRIQVESEYGTGTTFKIFLQVST